MISKNRKTVRIYFTIFLFFSLFFTVGCIQKTVFPAVLLTVTTVTPFTSEPTKPANASDPITMADIAVSVKADTQVPARLLSYSVDYATRLGDAIPGISVPETPYDLLLTPGGITTINFSVYTGKVLNLFFNTSSDISPILATINFSIKDVNGNTVKMQAHCLLKKPWWWG